MRAVRVLSVCIVAAGAGAAGGCARAGAQPTPDGGLRPVEAPRLIAPISGAFVAAGRPTFRFRLPRPEPATLEVCRDRACHHVVATVAVNGDSAEPAED